MNRESEKRKSRRLYGAFFLFQALAGVVWWAMIIGFPSTRLYFTFSPDPDTLLEFWLADIVLFVFASFFSGYLLLRNSRWAMPMIWLTVGGISYATLYNCGSWLWHCLFWNQNISSKELMYQSGMLGIALMGASMLVSITIAIDIIRPKS